MNSILHIANGDSTANILENTTLKGDIIVWRELLCEGPLTKVVGSDEFWLKRYAYFETELNISKLEYFDKTIRELVKLEDLTDYNEVVLWFEFDLFCQVNLMALCSYLFQNFKKGILFYLVCTGKVKGKTQLQPLSNFSEIEFLNLYKKKIKISKSNLEYAKECWEVYVKNDYKKLQKFDFNKSSKFNYFQMAIDQHLKRFPDENGLNEIDNKILEIVSSKALTKSEIVSSLLTWQEQETVYGFTDLQYIKHIKNLKKYIKKNDSKYYLNNFEKMVIKK